MEKDDIQGERVENIDAIMSKALSIFEGNSDLYRVVTSYDTSSTAKVYPW